MGLCSREESVWTGSSYVSKDELLNRGNSDDELSKPTFIHTERALVEENAASVESEQNSIPQQTRQCGRYMYGRHDISSTASPGFISRPGPSHAQPLLHSNNASCGPSSSRQFQLEASQIESLLAIFPHLSENDARSALINYGSVEGEAKRRLPLFRSEHVVSGIFEIVGKMIAHSLVQGGPGFPYLAPVVYSYISTGDLQAALLHVSAVDVCDPTLSTIIERVRL